MKLVKIWKVLPSPFFLAFGKGSELDMHGSNQYVFRLCPGKVLEPWQSEAVGRILVHGLVLTGYLPVFMNKAQHFYILTRSTPSDDTLLECFLETICILERQLLEQALKCIFFEETMTLKLADLFSQYDTMGIQILSV